MQRMYNAGYNIDALGECYGMTTASMCAFLAGDMSSFNQRLIMIRETSEIDFNKNFTGYRFVLIDDDILDKIVNKTLNDTESNSDGKIYVQINGDNLVYLFYSEGSEYSGFIPLEEIDGSVALENANLWSDISQLDRYSSIIQEIILSKDGDVLNFGLRNKQRKLMNEGRHEEATILNNQIIEMTAFFDTLALNQSPAEYSFLFEWVFLRT